MEKAQAIMRSQMSEEEMKKRVSRTIDNAGDLQALEEQLQAQIV